MAREAGWYDDPQDESILRYWDGVQWTQHTSPRVRPGLDQAGAGPAAAQYGQQGEQGQYGQPPGQYGQQQGWGQYGQPGRYGQQGGTEPADPYAAAPGQYPYGQQQGWGQPMPGGGYAAAYGVPTTPDGQPLAGWGMRLLARILDALVLGILGAVTLFVVAPDLTTHVTEYMEDMLSAVEAGSTTTPAIPEALTADLLRGGLASGVVFLLYELLMLRFFSATLGKLATGLRVRLREQPGQLPWGAAGVRSVLWQGPNLLSGVSFLGTLATLFTILNGLWPLWDRNRQALHDKAARTNVVKRR